MFNIREMKPEDKAIIMPMVITFYHSPVVEHDVDTAVLERTFDAATDPAMPYISGLVMLESCGIWLCHRLLCIRSRRNVHVHGRNVLYTGMPGQRLRYKSLSLDYRSLSGI